MKNLILVLVSILLLTSCDKDNDQPKPSATNYTCVQKQADLKEIADNIKYYQTKLAQPTAAQRQYWINKIDDARKEYDEIQNKTCI